jgi:diketogulonate reductase-like aldo/keto reductase
MHDRRLTRREALRTGAGLGALAFLDPRGWGEWDPIRVASPRQDAMITKAIPSSGERIPVVGLGSWRTFDVAPDAAEAAEPLEVLRAFHEIGGTVVDTAPSYGASEAFVGHAARAAAATDDLFLATKVNVQGAGIDAARSQMEASARALGTETVDLMQVWNLGDDFRELSDRYLGAHLDAVRAWREEGRTRYIGITTSFPRQYDLIADALAREELDFVQLDYSIGDRVPEDRLLPLAADHRVAVLVNQPFTSGRLFSAVSGRDLPAWAGEIDCESWAQFFLKYIVSHPAVTCAIPATSDPAHLADNMRACFGRLPDEATRRRMVELFESL